MIDVKKLTIGFLILALSGGASALIVSNIDTSTAALTAPNTAVISAQGVKSQPTGLSGSAFVDQPSAANNGALAMANVTLDAFDASSTDAIASDPNNLTAIFAEKYVSGIVASNPAEPQVDENGNSIIAAPDQQLVISQFSASSSIAGFQTPDWDVDAAKIPVTVTASSSEAMTNYGAAVKDIFNRHFVQSNIQATISDTSDPKSAAVANDKIQTALRDIAGLQVPPVAMAFHKTLVKLLVYEKNALALTQTATKDPLKAALTLEAITPKYNAAVLSFQNELQQLPAGQSLSFGGEVEKDTSLAGFFRELAGIQTAHAQWITFDPTNFAQWLLKFLKDLILQLLKNLIINLLQKQALKFVHNSGAPRVIQQWGATLINAYTQKAINVLNSEFECVNPLFLPQVKLLLKIPTPSPGGAGSNVCAAQFAAGLSGNTLRNFVGHFDRGGFPTYLAMFQPGGNMFGASIDIQDRAMNAAAQSQQAAQAKSVADQGWKGSAVCTDGSDPTNGTHFVCADNSRPSNDGFCFVVGQPPQLAALAPNNGFCADGQDPRVTNPGQATGQIFHTSVDSGSKLATAANEIVGLLQAFLSSFMNSLANEAVTAVNGALP